MKKIRLILALALASSTFAACSSSITAPDDCPVAGSRLDCGWPGGDG